MKGSSSNYLYTHTRILMLRIRPFYVSNTLENMSRRLIRPVLNVFRDPGVPVKQCTALVDKDILECIYHFPL